MSKEFIVFYVVAGVVALLIDPGKGGFCGLLGIVVTPLMSPVMPVSEVAGLVLPVLILGDIFAVGAHWRRWDTYIFMRLMPGALVGVFVGAYVVATTGYNRKLWIGMREKGSVSFG